MAKRQDPIALFARVGQEALQAVYLLCGNEEYLLQKALDKLIERALDPETRELNFDRFESGDLDCAALVARARTAPFLSSRRLLVFQHKRRLSNTDDDILDRYVNDPNPSTSLILMAPSVDTSLKTHRTLAAQGRVFEFQILPAATVNRWVRKRLEEKGHAINPDAVALLVEVVGCELSRLDQELRKLMAYAGPSAAITLADVEATVVGAKQHSIFEFINALFARQEEKALRLLQQLFSQGLVPLQLLALLVQQLRKVWQIKTLLDGGCSVAQASMRAHIPTYLFEGMHGQSKNFRKDELRAAFARLGEVDRLLKSTNLPPQVVWEGLVLGLCRNL